MQSRAPIRGALNGPSFFSAGVPNHLYRALRDLGPVGHPATRVPEWQRYYNSAQILKPLFQSTPFAFLIPFFYNETPAVSFSPTRRTRTSLRTSTAGSARPPVGITCL